MTATPSTATPTSVARLLDQLVTLESLDRLPRTGFLQRGVARPESVAEHSWHVATLVWTLLPHVGALDGLRALELALLHDVGEALIGDLPRPARRLFPEGAKEGAEEKAVLEVLGGSRDRALALIDELRHRSSPEAVFVHLCDKLQLIIKTSVYAEWNEGASRSFLEELVEGDRRRDAALDERFRIVAELREAVASRHGL